LPFGKDTVIGAWENDKFIGCILFRNGAKDLGTPYGLTQWECVELARIALTKHETPVSRIATIAVKMLKKLSPKLRLLVSFADPFQNHHGGIYQAMNWIYTGRSGASIEYFVKGKWYHGRDFSSSDWSSVSGIDKSKLEKREKPGKHRYLFPLDDAMRKQIEPLRKPYPKRGTGETDNAAQSNAQTGGASPTRSLLITDN
jgi:hypothetical protein